MKNHICGRLNALIFTLAVILAMAAVFIYTPVLGYDQNNPQEVDYALASSKIANSGTESTLNGVTYALNSQGKLYSYDLSSGSEAILFHDYVSAFAIYNDLVYMAVHNELRTDIITLNPTTNITKPVATIDGNIESFAVKNGEVFYLLNNTIYMGNTPLLTKKGITSFDLQINNTIGYFATGGYYNYNCETGNSTLIAESSQNNQTFASLSATSFSPRLEAPASTNQYYYSSSNIFWASGYGMPNCTAYAYGRAYEILGKAPRLCTGNAGKWFDYNVKNGAFTYGQTPKLGAIAVWANNSEHNQGHVAVVEKLNANGTITISESHYGGTNFLTKTNKITSMYTNKAFLGFIYILNDAVTTETVSTPTISHTNITGGKAISISCGTSGAAIYYTTDGSNPSSSSKKYTGSFNISTTTTVKAIAVKAGMNNSYAAGETFTFSTTQQPTSNLTSNTAIALGSSVALSSATKDATIYYTTDGSTPTTSSAIYQGAITVRHSMVIQAIAVGPGGSVSAISSFQYTVWDNPFNDIEINSWYFSDLSQAYEENYITGTSSTSFAPNDKTTRAMFVTMLSRLDATHDISNYELIFDDVLTNMWYTDAISWAEANSIVQGIGNNKFAPDSNITREQACVIMVNYAKSYDITLSSDIPAKTFKDEAQTSDYAKDAVYAAQRGGLINGRTDGNFDPKGTASRAEVTSIIMRMVRLYLQ